MPAPPPATPGAPPAPVTKVAAWIDRVQIQSGPDTAPNRLHAPDVALHIVTATTVNRRRSAAADAPVGMAAAIAHCNAFPIKEFAPR